MVNRMSVSLTEFASMLGSNPMLAITALLTIGVILVNGWTDAPNAIATCVSTRAMKAGAAIAMAAVFNFLGVLVMTMINSRVAMTIYNMVDFGGNEQDATIALCAALFAIVAWATAAWKFGIPTSESHALIAGLSGAAIALHGSFAGINPQEWVKVIYGLVLSTVLGFVAGFGAARLIEWICRRMDRRKTTVFFRGGQIAGAASMAFMHGAQDGQKFMSVFLLGIFLSSGQGEVSNFAIPMWLMILCSLVMLRHFDRYRITNRGYDMVRLRPLQGFAADIMPVACLCSFAGHAPGVPAGTTHTKPRPSWAGASKRLSAVNWRIVKEMTLAWVLTFPGCALLLVVNCLWPFLPRPTGEGKPRKRDNYFEYLRQRARLPGRGTPENRWPTSRAGNVPRMLEVMRTIEKRRGWISRHDMTQVLAHEFIAPIERRHHRACPGSGQRGGRHRRDVMRGCICSTCSPFARGCEASSSSRNAATPCWKPSRNSATSRRARPSASTSLR